MRHSVRHLSVRFITVLTLAAISGLGFLGSARNTSIVAAPTPDTQSSAKLFYVLIPENLDSAIASDLLISSHTELGRKLSEERIRSRLHGGPCREGERCEEVIILGKESSNYRIRIFCSTHPDDLTFPSVDNKSTAMKIARMVSKHDSFHK